MWTDFLLCVGKKVEEIETLELFAGCKPAFRSQKRKHRDHSRCYLRRKSYYRSKECEKKLNKMEQDSVYWI